MSTPVDVSRGGIYETPQRVPVRENRQNEDHAPKGLEPPWLSLFVVAKCVRVTGRLLVVFNSESSRSPPEPW